MANLEGRMGDYVSPTDAPGPSPTDTPGPIYKPGPFAEQFLEEPVFYASDQTAYSKLSITVCTFRGVPLIDDGD